MSSRPSAPPELRGKGAACAAQPRASASMGATLLALSAGLPRQTLAAARTCLLCPASTSYGAERLPARQRGRTHRRAFACAPCRAMPAAASAGNGAAAMAPSGSQRAHAQHPQGQRACAVRAANVWPGLHWPCIGPAWAPLRPLGNRAARDANARRSAECAAVRRAARRATDEAKRALVDRVSAFIFDCDGARARSCALDAGSPLHPRTEGHPAPVVAGEARGLGLPDAGLRGRARSQASSGAATR
jgi:hypothetical protein